MNTLKSLLEAAQKATQPPTVAGLCERLGVSRQTFYTWKRAEADISDEHLARLIDLAGAEPASAIAVRLEGAHSIHERAMWRSVARRLGAAASLAAVALFTTYPASSAPPREEVAQLMHYAK